MSQTDLSSASQAGEAAVTSSTAPSSPNHSSHHEKTMHIRTTPESGVPTVDTVGGPTEEPAVEPDTANPTIESTDGDKPATGSTAEATEPKTAKPETTPKPDDSDVPEGGWWPQITMPKKFQQLEFSSTQKRIAGITLAGVALVGLYALSRGHLRRR